MIFSHVKNIVFLRVFRYDFSQWPKTLYNTDVYKINSLPSHSSLLRLGYCMYCGCKQHNLFYQEISQRNIKKKRLFPHGLLRGFHNVISILFGSKHKFKSEK